MYEIFQQYLKFQSRIFCQVAGQHSLQLTSYQTECGSLKQQLDVKIKEVEQLQEKVEIF